MEGFTTKKAAEKLNISIRQVQKHGKNGLIKDVLMFVNPDTLQTNKATL